MDSDVTLPDVEDLSVDWAHYVQEYVAEDDYKDCPANADGKRAQENAKNVIKRYDSRKRPSNTPTWQTEIKDAFAKVVATSPAVEKDGSDEDYLSIIKRRKQSLPYHTCYRCDMSVLRLGDSVDVTLVFGEDLTSLTRWCKDYYGDSTFWASGTATSPYRGYAHEKRLLIHQFTSLPNFKDNIRLGGITSIISNAITKQNISRNEYVMVDSLQYVLTTTKPPAMWFSHGKMPKAWVKLQSMVNHWIFVATEAFSGKIYSLQFQTYEAMMDAASGKMPV